MRARLRTGLALALASVPFVASAALASGNAHGGMTLDQILWELGIKVLDVSIIAFFGFKFLSKPIASAMAGRAEGVRRSLEEATAGRREAEARLREIQEKNSRLEAEVEALTTQTGLDIAREQAILLDETQAAAERIRQHARETMRQEMAKARAELHREAADLAMRLATETVRAGVTAEDQRRLAREYVKEMEAAR